MNFRILLLLLLQLVSAASIAQDVNKGYVREVLVTQKGVLNQAEVESLYPSYKVEQLSYLNSQGQLEQQILYNATTSGQAMVSMQAYDSLGRTVKSYLPYAVSVSNKSFRSSALSEQSTFYSGSTAGVAGDVAPYAVSVYEQSPLSRLIEQGAPGSDWQPGTNHTQRISYRANTTADNVRRWLPTGQQSPGYYAAGALSVSILLDENGNQVLSFQDKSGHVVLKRVELNASEVADTYYVYDSHSRIRLQISPEASRLLTGTTPTLTTDLLNTWCFQYVYDERGRMVESKAPGMEAVFTVYDKLNRPILVQDGNSRQENRWIFTKYDNLNRALYSGTYIDATRTTRQAMQTHVNTQTQYHESRSASATFRYYTNTSFPIVAAANLLNSYHYDDYNFNNDATLLDFAVVTGQVTGQAAVSYEVRGLLTGKYTKVVGGSAWLSEIYFYDTYDRLLQMRSNNILNTTVSDISTYTYNEAGQVDRIKILVKPTSSATDYTVSRNEYYNNGQLKRVFHSINGLAEQLLFTLNYNALGQVIEKNLAYKGSNSQDQAINYLQSVDYAYNIRGWLQKINSSTLSAVSGESQDLFGMELFYNTTAGLNAANTAQYNGNISAVKWQSKNPAVNDASRPQRERSYRYQYDKADRLLSATYMAKNGSTWNVESGAYDVNGLQYDRNGNIQRLIRYSQASASVARVKIDDLTYGYTNSGNRLSSVQDTGHASEGFANGSNTSTEYTYDPNGNMLTDLNKGLTVSYNLLNKVAQSTKSATGDYEQHSYNGEGQRLQSSRKNGSIIQTTTYLRGFEYEGTTLKRVSIPDGRIEKQGSSFEYQYALTDHQGNVRMMFRNQNGQAQVLQEKHYDPFGYVLQGVAVCTPEAIDNRYLYNGPGEYQNLSEMHSTFFREYDATLGRFHAVDIMTHNFSSWTPYNYAFNNPVLHNDPSGAAPPRSCSNCSFVDEWLYFIDPLPQMDGKGAFSSYSEQVSQRFNDFVFSLRLSYFISKLTVGVNGTGDGNGNIIPGTETYVYYDEKGNWVDPANVTSTFINVLHKEQNGGIYNATNATLNVSGGIISGPAGIMALRSWGHEKLLNEGQWLGKNGRTYSTGFNGSDKWLSGTQKAFKAAGSAAKAAGNTLGGLGVLVSAGSAYNAFMNDKDNTSTWVDVTITGGLFIGGLVAGITAAPVVATLGVAYGVYRLTAGSQGDALIDQYFGYR